MTLKISRSQVSTQPNPTHQKFKKTLTQPNPIQPNPWMDPTHDQLCRGPVTSRVVYKSGSLAITKSSHFGFLQWPWAPMWRSHLLFWVFLNIKTVKTMLFGVTPCCAISLLTDGGGLIVSTYRGELVVYVIRKSQCRIGAKNNQGLVVSIIARKAFKLSLFLRSCERACLLHISW